MAGCPHPVLDAEFSVNCTGGDDVLQMLGRKFLIVGASGIDLVISCYRQSGNARAIAAVVPIKVRSEDEDSPVAATGSHVTASGTTEHLTHSLTGTTDRMFAQIGVLGDLSGGSTPGFVHGRVRAYLTQCSAMLRPLRIAASPQSDATNPSMHILGRVGASGATSVRTGLVIDGAKDIEYRLFGRGVNDPDKPGTWTGLGGGYTSITDGNTATCLGDLSLSGLSPSSYHELEIALGLRMKSGGSGPAGFLRVISGVGYT